MVKLTPNDAQTMLAASGALSNPKGTALSFLGLSPEEQRAGIPGWAWAILALGVGVYLGNRYSAKLKGVIT